MHALSAFLVLALAAFLPAVAAAAQDPAIRGHVVAESGTPLPDATVYIWTAGVKTGYSTYCPSCYRDCGRSDRSDADGAFSFTAVDPDLKFRLLVVADGHVPTFVPGIDPLSPDSVKAVLKPRAPVAADSPRVLRGIVLGADGKPLEGAAVSPNVVWWTGENGRPTGRGGAVEGLDPIAVTNASGEFMLTYKDDTTKWDISVEARAHARFHVKDLASGPAPHTIRMNRGGAIQGRLVLNGVPVGGVEVGISHADRSSSMYLGNQVIGTREDGTFEFVNLQSGTEWNVYAKMGAVKHLGATPAQRVRVGADESTVEVGDVKIVRAHRIAGRVVLSDGKPVPKGSQVLLCLEEAWDSQTTGTDEHGGFVFTGVPRANVNIDAAVKGYKHSRSNPHLSWSIEGLVDRDITDFVILLDPGEEDYVDLGSGMFTDKPLQSIVWPLPEPPHPPTPPTPPLSPARVDR